jgi:ATP-grasp domain, R2K clade family 2
MRKAAKPELLLSTRSLPGGMALAAAAREAGWRVSASDEHPPPRPRGRPVYYGGSDVAEDAASRYDIALLEPPLDLLARLPFSLLLRPVHFTRFRELALQKYPTFLKPADPLDKVFDAGVYRDAHAVRALRQVGPDTPVLVSEPVEWLAEYRCFVCEGQVVATLPYLSFGRPVWKPFGQGGDQTQASATVLAFCHRLLRDQASRLPPAFVVDVGLIDERGWAVVEFNLVWCAGILGADPKMILTALERASRNVESLTASDRCWVVQRPHGPGHRFNAWES